MSEDTTKKQLGTIALSAGDVVGVADKHWFVAVISNNTEKTCSERLKNMGYESFVPVQSEMHCWRNGKVKTIDRVVISAVLLVYSTKSERKEIVNFSFVKPFMSNCGAKEDSFKKHPVAIVPDRQVEILRFMLDQANTSVSIESVPIHLGDKVRVIRGKLQGLEGNAINCKDGNMFIMVCLDQFGCAKVNIKYEFLERI